MAVDDKLCGFAGLQDSWDEGPFDFCALNEDGKVIHVIDSGFSGEWAWNIWERLGDLILFTMCYANGSETGLQAIYDPATGAVFYAYDKEKQEGA